MFREGRFLEPTTSPDTGELSELLEDYPMNANGFRDAVKQRYDFAHWPRDEQAKPASTPRAFVFDPDRAMVGFVLEDRSASPTNGSAYIDRYVNGADPSIRIIVRVTRFPSREAAYEGLIAFLETLMSPKLARSTERNIQLGDIAYCGFEDPLTQVIFVRRDVLARLMSIGDKDVSVAELAQRIDLEILNSTG